MQVWTKNTKFIAILQIFSETGKLNSKATKKALNCTASIAADSIVNAISLSLVYCSVTQNQFSAKSGSGSGRIWVPKSGQIWLWQDLKKSNSVQP